MAVSPRVVTRISTQIKQHPGGRNQFLYLRGVSRLFIDVLTQACRHPRKDDLRVVCMIRAVAASAAPAVQESADMSGDGCELTCMADPCGARACVGTNELHADL